MFATGKKLLALFSMIAVFGVAAAAPAHADWWDGHRYHHGHVPHGWVYDPHLHYYVYAPQAVVAAPPGAVIVTQPAPPPAAVVVTQPVPPVVVTTPPPPPPVAEPSPIGVNLGVHIH